MRLSDYLRTEFVFTDLEASGPEEALAFIANRLASAGASAEQDQMEAALLERERAHTTAMGRGFALPHATIPGMSEAILAILVAPNGVPFGSEGDEPVKVFFTLLSPPGREGEHIKLLARICRLVRHPGFVASVAESEDEDEVVETVRRVDEEHF